MIKTEWKDQGNNTGKLCIVVGATKWKDAQAKATETLVKDVKVDGFRDGKAPVSVAKSKVNQGEVLDMALNNVLNDAFIQGIQEHKLLPIVQPTINVTAISDVEVQVECVIVQMPEIELGEYKGLEATKEEVVVTEEEINAEIDGFLQQQAQMVVQDRAIESGDTVIFDYKGLKQDVAFEGGTAENAELVIGSNQFIPGFEDKMIGLVAGQEAAIELTFPEDYHSEELKGQDVVFEVKIHEVKTRQVPELTDELVVELQVPEVATASELKDKIIESIKARKEADSENKYVDALLGQIITNSKLELADALVRDRQEGILQQTVAQYAQQGITEDLFIQILGGGDREKLLETYKEQALKDLQSQFITDAIAKAENIEATPEEVEAHLEEMATMYGMTVEMIKEQIPNLSGVEYQVRINKVLNFIKDNAK